MPDKPEDKEERDDALKQPDEKVKDLDVDEESGEKVEGGREPGKIEFPN
jgi:hypothetical protein